MKLTRSCTTILLLFTATTTTLAQDTSCFSLRNSKTCAAFQNFYISLIGNQNQYPFLANVTDINSFDEGVKNLMKTASPYYELLGCMNKATETTTIPYARYSYSYLCASLIQDSSYSLPCNYKNNLSPPPLCQSTCFDYTSSVETITSNVELCPNQAEQQSKLEYLNSTCIYWTGLNGTVNCILGVANEPDNCGFQLLSDGCEYCKTNSQDTCCKSLNGCRSLSVGAIIGIIIGCLAVASILGAIIFYFSCRNKRSKNGVSYTNTGFNMKTKIENQNDSTSALGYESLGSRGVLLPPPPPPPPQQQQQQQQEQLLFNKPTVNTNQLLPPLPPPLLQQQLEEFYQVKHPYPPQMGDELGLHVGDIVCVAMNFDDGWALGFNVTTGLKGVFPIVCVSPAPEELLEQLLYDQPTNKTLVEDGSLEHLNMQQICENLRRSMSASSKRTIHTLPTSELTQHSNIPRRTASMMRNSYDYRESDSPTSPTLHTPLFDVNILQQQQQNNSSPLSQPEPALFQPIETYEMYRKNNRVSKLEE